MPASKFFVSLGLCVGIFGSCKPMTSVESGVGSADAAMTSELPAVSTLTQDYFAKHAIGISNEVFAKRWRNSLASPLVFFRSHVRAYYDITKKLALPNTTTGVCFGDAHLANFGFIEGKDGKARFLYNDLDDSGICPVALDALRYFTSLRFLEQGDRVEKEIDLYFSVMSGKEDSKKVSKRFEPDFKAVRSEILKKSSDKGRLIREASSMDDVAPALAADVSKFVDTILGSEGLPGKVVDVALASGHGGGSFGLTRYWALVHAEQDDVVEVKESVEPATSLGNWGQVSGDRLSTLKDVFWGGAYAARVYREGVLQQKKYVVRSRVKVSLNPEDLDSGDREAIYAAQVSLMAELHKKTIAKLSDAEAKRFSKWLATESKELSKLYSTVFSSAK
jgi:hypothetical protein